MPVTVRFDPTSVSKQAQIIPDASEFNAGVMTPEQVRQLDNTSPVTLDGDVTGDPSANTVVGIQGQGVDPEVPNEQDVLTFVMGEWRPQAPSGGTLAGDVVGPAGANKVVGLQNVVVAATAPNDSDVLTYNQEAHQWEPQPGGGGGNNTVSGLSAVKYCNIHGAVATGVSLTTGIVAQFTEESTITGMTFYWPGGKGALVLKCSVWDHLGAQVATGTVAVNAAGIYTIVFGAPVVVGPTDIYQDYTFGVWENSGSWYTSNTDANTVPGSLASTVSYLANAFLFIKDAGIFAAGDAEPDTNSPTNYFPVAPVFTSP